MDFPKLKHVGELKKVSLTIQNDGCQRLCIGEKRISKTRQGLLYGKAIILLCEGYGYGVQLQTTVEFDAACFHTVVCCWWWSRLLFNTDSFTGKTSWLDKVHMSDTMEHMEVRHLYCIVHSISSIGKTFCVVYSSCLQLPLQSDPTWRCFNQRLKRLPAFHNTH